MFDLHNCLLSEVPMMSIGMGRESIRQLVLPFSSNGQ